VGSIPTGPTECKTENMNKTQLVQAIAEETELTRAQVNSVLDSLTSAAERSLREDGEFAVPGVVRLKVKEVPAKPERVGLNPFTRLQQTFPAKPASKGVKALPAASLKKSLSGP
jgi:DNA-binding protein HU-beta